MTALAYRRSYIRRLRRHPSLVGPLVASVDVITAAATVGRPLVVTAGIITAAATWAAPGQDGPLDGSLNHVLTAEVTIAIAGPGQSSCPTLVRPAAGFGTPAYAMPGAVGPPRAITGVCTCIAITDEMPNVDVIDRQPQRAVPAAARCD